MEDFLKLLIVFVGIIVGIRKKIFVGYILFAAGVLTALLYQVSFSEAFVGYKELILSKNFLYLYGMIILITFLGRVLKEIGYLDRLVKSSENLIGGARTASAALPPLVGLMPMPGGALLSAPLIGKILSSEKYTPEFRTVMNYWSRHIVEFCWPVYPGLILSAALTSMPIGTIALLQLPMTFIMVAIGIIFFVREIEVNNNGVGQFIRPFFKIIVCVWPILLAIVIYAIFPIALVWAVLISVILLLLKEKPSLVQLKIVGKEAFTPRLFILTYGVLSFQMMLEITGAVGSIPKLSAQLGLPAAFVIILVAFSSGLLTGILFALVGLAYPLLAGYLYDPQVNLANIFLAFVSGYIGMIFSPTHFCLILTNEYFRSNLGKVYRLLTVPLLILFAIGFLLYLIGYPWNIFR